MAVTISKLSVVLSGSTSGLESTLNAGKESVLSFESTVESAGRKVTGILAGLGVGLSVAGITEYLKSTFESIDATAKLSESLGIATDSLGRLQYAAQLAGVSNDDLDTGLKKMLKSLYDAQQGMGEAGKAFSAIGLNTQDLVNMKPDAAFAKIGDALRNIQNPAERAGATMEIFGRNGATLLPILTQGSAKLGEIGAEADKFGLALSKVDATQIEQAHESIAGLEGAIEGAADQLVVRMAPYIQAAANKLTELGTHGDGMAKMLVNGFESVVMGIAKATDYLELLGGAWDTVKSGAEYAIAGIQWALGKVLETAGKVLDYFHVSHAALDQFVDDLKKSHQDMVNDAGKAWDQVNDHFNRFMDGTNSKTAADFFHGLESSSRTAAEQIAGDSTKIGGAFDDIGDGAKQLEKVTAKLTDLQKQVDEFGLSKGDKLAHELKDMGASSDQIAKGQALASQLDHLEEIKKAQDDMAKDAKQLWEESQTPAEKYANELQKINTLLASNQISQETADRARDKAADDLLKSQNKDEPKAPELLEAGTQAVAHFVAEVQQKQKSEERQEKLIQLAQKQVESLGRIADAVSSDDKQEMVGVDII